MTNFDVSTWVETTFIFGRKFRQYNPNSLHNVVTLVAKLQIIDKNDKIQNHPKVDVYRNWSFQTPHVLLSQHASDNMDGIEAAGSPTACGAPVGHARRRPHLGLRNPGPLVIGRCRITECVYSAPVQHNGIVCMPCTGTL